MIFAGVAIALFTALPAACWLGYWLGRRTPDDGTERARASTWQSALLALAGLLIGFTFSMAESRFSHRKEIVVAEANAIGTAYLRTRLLDDPAGNDLRVLLRRYVYARLAFVDAGADRGRVDAALRESGALEGQIWSAVAAAARADRHSPITGLLVQAVNDMIDADAVHVASVENPLPRSVFLVLFLATAAAMTAVGFGCGLDKSVSTHGMVVMPLLLAMVILLVFDLAHPRFGVVRVTDPALIALAKSL